MNKSKVYRVYGDLISGNCYKIKLLMHCLSIEYEWVHVDILKGETHAPEFLAVNSNAKVLVLQIGQSEYLSESNAILNFLAEGTRFLPSHGIERAKVLQWQFFEQYSHEPYVAVARYIKKYLGLPDERSQEYHAKRKGGYKALSVMENHLSKNHYLVGNTPTIADISLYAYTHVAHEGGFDLRTYSNIQSWLGRIEFMTGYVGV